MTAVESSTAPTPDDSPAPLGDVVGRDVLEARCQLLEQSVRASGHIPAAEIDAVRPGGGQNPDTSAHGWLHFLCNLHRMHERGPAVVSTGGTLRWNPAAMEAVREALAAEPVHLRLASGVEVAVHPKSEYALNRLVVIDRTLQFVVERRIAMEDEEPTPVVLQALRTAVDLQHRLESEFAAIVCAPGADVPATPDANVWDLPLPPWTHTLEAVDLIAIRRAHLAVNLGRIHEITERSKQYANGAGSSLPVAAFLGVMASELGVQPRDLARRWSLGEVFAQALLKWEQAEQIRRDAANTPPE